MNDQCKHCKHLFLGHVTSTFAQFCHAPLFVRDPSPNEQRTGDAEPGGGRHPWAHAVVVDPDCPGFALVDDGTGDGPMAVESGTTGDPPVGG
jgi:hypothetical protein